MNKEGKVLANIRATFLKDSTTVSLRVIESHVYND